MWTVLIPIVFIGGIFVVFYLFKDKFTGKFTKLYDNANQEWAADKEGVIREMYSNPDKLKMLQDAVGETPIECLYPCEPKKSFAKKLLKGTAEVLTSHQTFDMSLYYLAIAGGELHMMQSDGKMITSHDAFTLKNLRQVDIRPEGAATKVANLLTANDASAGSRESIFFNSNGEDYSFRLLDMFQGYPAFTVEKGYSSGKHGQNPFYRIFKADETFNMLFTSIYAPETMAQFKAEILKLK